MTLTYDQALAAARRKAAEADFGSPFRYRLTSLVVDRIRKYCVQDARVLDLGCGSGRYAYFFVEAGIRGSYTGVDLDPHSLDGFELEGLFSSRLLAMDAHRIDELGEKFDFLLSITSMEHFEDDRRVVRGMAEVMQKSAHALVAVPSAFSYALYGRHGFRRYSRNSVKRLAAEAGLDVVELSSVCGAASFLFHASWFLPARAVSLAGSAFLYALAGWNKGKARRALPRVFAYLDRMGEHHLRGDGVGRCTGASFGLAKRSTGFSRSRRQDTSPS